MNLIFKTLLALLLSTSINSFAQNFKDSWSLFYKDHYVPLPQPELGRNLGFNIGNKVFKPEGDGPFPAIVLVHTAGGLQNEHIKIHAQNLLSKGYVVHILDSLGPRRVPVVTRNTPNVHPPIGVRDAYHALEFLSQQSYVDKNRIYQMGTSWGGFVASSLASKGIAEVNEAKGRFRASVGFYSTCQLGAFDPYKYVFPDSDRPVLLLLAGDDKELSHRGLGDCFKELDDLKKQGLPIEYYVYEGIGHGWDKRGEIRLGYIYSESTTKDSFKRMLEFFEKNQ